MKIIIEKKEAGEIVKKHVIKMFPDKVVSMTSKYDEYEFDITDGEKTSE